MTASMLKLAALILAVCSVVPVDGLVIPHGRQATHKRPAKDGPLGLRQNSRFFRPEHFRRTEPESISEPATGIDQVVRRQTASLAQGVPGTISIMNSARTTKIGSLLMDNSTANGNSTSSSFVMNASNTSSTELFLVPIGGNSSIVNSTMPVTLQLPILDAASASLTAYCATMDDTPGVPTAVTVEPCLDQSNVTTTGPFVVHKVQTFSYDIASGMVTPQFQTTTTSSNGTSGMPKRNIVARESAASSAPSAASSSASVTSTSASVASSGTSAAPSSAASVASTPVSAASSVAPTSVTSTPASVASSAAPTSTPSAANTDAVLVFVPSVSGEVTPKEDVVVANSTDAPSAVGANATQSGNSTGSISSTVPASSTSASAMPTGLASNSTLFANSTMPANTSNAGNASSTTVNASSTSTSTSTSTSSSMASIASSTPIEFVASQSNTGSSSASIASASSSPSSTVNAFSMASVSSSGSSSANLPSQSTMTASASSTSSSAAASETSSTSAAPETPAAPSKLASMILNLGVQSVPPPPATSTSGTGSPMTLSSVTSTQSPASAVGSTQSVASPPQVTTTVTVTQSASATGSASTASATEAATASE